MKIPKGWRKLKCGEIIKNGDEFMLNGHQTRFSVFITVGQKHLKKHERIVIRKIKATK